MLRGEEHGARGRAGLHWGAGGSDGGAGCGTSRLLGVVKRCRHKRWRTRCDIELEGCACYSIFIAEAADGAGAGAGAESELEALGGGRSSRVPPPARRRRATRVEWVTRVVHLRFGVRVRASGRRRARRERRRRRRRKRGALGVGRRTLALVVAAARTRPVGERVLTRGRFRTW